MSSRRSRSGGIADLDDIQPVEQIAAETPRRDFGSQVPVGRREDLDVHAPWLERADAIDIAELQHAQQLGLDAQRQVGDFVEQEHASIGGFEEPGAIFHGPREGPPHMAEQLALEQRLDDGRTVHDDKGPRAAAPCPVDGPGCQLLPGAGLSRDERSPDERRQPRDGADEVTHRGASSHHPQRVGGVSRINGLVSALSDRGVDLAKQLINPPGVERLAQIVHRANLDRFDGGLDARESGHQHHLAAGIRLVDRTKHLQPIQVRHPEIDHDEVGADAAAGRNTRGAGRAGHDIEAGLLPEVTDGLEDRRLVVDDQ